MRATWMRTKVRSATATHQRTETVSNLRLLPRLSQVSVNGGSGRGPAGLLGGLHSAERSKGGGNISRVIQFNRIHQGLMGGLRSFQLVSGGNGAEARLFGSQKFSDISNLRWRQAEVLGQEIDLPVDQVLCRWGREGAVHPPAGLRAENSHENHR